MNPVIPETDLKVINIGLQSFAKDLENQGVAVIHLDWRPPAGGNPAIIPGIGIAKEFKTDAYDFPLAEANLTFAPNKFFDLQLGYGRNFRGDGYRSLLLSDGASPYPFLNIKTG